MLATNRQLFLGAFLEDDIANGRHLERVRKAKEKFFTSFAETRMEYVNENGSTIVKLYICDERKH